jgi:hypothetical protein
MTPAAFRKAALSFPESSEEPHFERTSFRVGKKIFATMTADGKEAMVRVPDRERLHGLLETRADVFFSYGGWTERNGALGIRLAKADAATLRELLSDSWRAVAPKRIQSRSER